MNTKLLLCMMALWAVCAVAQPRVTDNGFLQMPTPHPVLTKPITTESPATNKRATKAKAGAIPVQVDFVLDFDTENQIAFDICLVNNEYDIHNDQEPNELYELVNGSNVMTVPAGTYDIYVTFKQVDRTQEMYVLYDMYVIREQVTINENTQLNFAASEAKNHIHFETLTPEGDPVNLGKWAVDDEYQNWTMLEQANTDNFIYYKNIFCNDYGWILLNYGWSEVTIEEGPHRRVGHEYSGDFFVNDVSDRYTFYTYRWGLSGHEVFTVSHEVQGASSDLTISNNPSDYTLFQEPFKAQKHQGKELYMTIEAYNTLAGDTDGVTSISNSLSTPLAEGEMGRYYISASMDDSRVGYIPFLEPSVGQIVTETTPWGWEQQQYVPALVGMRMTKVNGELVFANNGVASIVTKKTGTVLPRFDIEFDPESGFVHYPLWSSFNPAFSYPVDKKEGNLGDNCPILVVDAGLKVDQGNRLLLFPDAYLGRYGEKKADDAVDAQVHVYANGEYYGSAEPGRFSIGLGEDELTSGVADIYITNSDEAVTVDDMACSNKAQMHIVIGGEDQFSPTATMLHFKAGNGNVTDRFATALEGTLEFAAGDFNRKEIIDYASGRATITHDRQAPERVEVSYSPYGEDNWNDLPVEEVPDNYWPVMGWFYAGSLAGVTGEALNGWFDLKIRLTDAAGNWQEQVLSPAFRIDNLAYSSVATVGSDNAHEVARYNLAGQRVDADATGIVIIKMSDGTAHKILVP